MDVPRCWYMEHVKALGDNFVGQKCCNPCGWSVRVDDGTDRCFRNPKELQSWGCFYKCKYAHPPQDQITFELD